MRLLTPGANLPADVDKYLLPHEHEVITAAVLSDTVLRHSSGLTWIIWAIWGVVFLRFLWAAINWSVDYFIITSHRFIETTGLFTRNVAFIPMAKVTDFTFRRSFPGRILGYGTFIVESAGQDQALDNVSFIPYPEQLYLEACSLLLPSKDGGD